MDTTIGFSIDRLFELIQWGALENPGEARARERFSKLRDYFQKLLGKKLFEKIAGSEQVRVVDVMGGTGIAGVAFLAAHRALRGGKGEYKLTVVDARRKALGYASRWLSHAGLQGVELSTIIGDARRLPELLGGEKYDVALVWGSSLPHVDVPGIILLLAGLRESIAEKGVALIEQHDLLPRLLFANNYKDVLLEGEAITMHRGYDPRTGSVERVVYDARTMLYQGIMRTRIWEMSTIAGYAWLFFKRVYRDHYLEQTGGGRAATVVIASEPRSNAPGWEELWGSLDEYYKPL